MNAKYPKISIVTPSFNQGEYIEKTIKSVIDQGYPNLEYIIIDGGSTDNTVEVIKKYESHITYWISEQDKGQSHALNKGIAKSTGDIFNWINSDDYLEDGALFKVGEIFNNKSDIEVLCGWCRIFDHESGAEISKHRTELYNSLEETLVHQRINQPASFYKLERIRELGSINDDFHYAMDLDLWFRYLCLNGQNKVFLTDNLLAHFRMHNTSKTQLLQKKFRDEENIIWGKMLVELKADVSLQQYFSGSKIYNNSVRWDLIAVEPRKLLSAIGDKHFYEFYKKKFYAAGRFAFLDKLKRKEIPLSRHYFSLFFKLFIWDINFKEQFFLKDNV